MNRTQITRNQFDRVAKDFIAIAKEDVYIEFNNGDFWVLGSETAILRLKDKYQGSPNASSGFSRPFSSWYFRLEAESFTGNISNKEVMPLFK